jgi:hypothetical protein
MQGEPVGETVPVAEQADEDEAPKARKRLFRRGSDASPETASPSETRALVVPAVEPEPAAASEATPRAVVDRTVVFAGALAGFVGGAVSGAVVTTLLS